ncbi:MAG: response regulator [FCB group bacterium]|nr:response regulator [FCB group bacterium]
MRILVVDDSVTMRKIISKSLKTEGYPDVIEASDGADAMSKMSGVDLVLLDWNMPVMDGMSFVKEARQSPVFGSVPIIMVTTEGAQKEVLQALKEGVNDYVVKPFKTDTLIQKIESVING